MQKKYMTVIGTIALSDLKELNIESMVNSLFIALLAGIFDKSKEEIVEDVVKIRSYMRPIK